MKKQTARRGHPSSTSPLGRVNKAERTVSKLKYNKLKQELKDALEVRSNYVLKRVYIDIQLCHTLVKSGTIKNYCSFF
jgi:hypothetical protein